MGIVCDCACSNEELTPSDLSQVCHKMPTPVNEKLYVSIILSSTRLADTIEYRDVDEVLEQRPRFLCHKSAVPK